MMYLPETGSLQVVETEIVRYGDFKEYADSESKSGFGVWRLLTKLSIYAASGRRKNADPSVYSTTEEHSPFMYGETRNRVGELINTQLLTQVLPEDLSKNRFVNTFASIEPLRRYMDPSTAIGQYGVKPHTYDVMREYLAFLARVPELSPSLEV